MIYNEDQRYRFDWSVINDSKDTIQVKGKAGYSYVIRSNQKTHRRVHALRVSVMGSNLEDMVFDEHAPLSKFDKRLIQAFKQAIDDVSESYRRHYVSPNLTNVSDIQFTVELEDSHVEPDHDGSPIHSELLGCTLYINLPSNNNYPALYTVKDYGNKIFKSLYSEDETSGSDGRNLGAIRHYIYVNDPTNRSIPLYVNSIGEAVRVHVNRDEHTKPGLYIGYARGTGCANHLYYDLDKFDKNELSALGIYYTLNECLTSGGNSEDVVNLTQELKEKNNQLSELNSKIEDLGKALSKGEVTLSGLREKLQDRESRITDLEEKARASASDFAFRLNEAKTMAALNLTEARIKTAAEKHEARMKQFRLEAKLENVQSKSSRDNLGDLFKAAGVIIGAGASMYKVFA